MVFDDLVTVEYFLDYFVVGSRMLEEWVIHITASSWVNSLEVSFSLILQNSLLQIFLIFQI